MAELLAVSQEFTVKQQAHVEKEFHSRQFRFAAIVTVAAFGLSLSHSLFELGNLFDQEHLLVFACVCIGTAGTLRALSSVRRASDRLKGTGQRATGSLLESPHAA
jgi:hypothetical protein